MIFSIFGVMISNQAQAIFSTHKDVSFMRNVLGLGIDQGIQIGLLIVTAAGVIFALIQLMSQNKTSSADFLHSVTNDFFNEFCRDILILIDHKALSYNRNTECFIINTKKLKKMPISPQKIKELTEKKIFTTYEVDDFLLGPIEQLGYFYSQKLIKDESIYETFGLYIDQINSCHNNPIMDYIEDMREKDIDKDKNKNSSDIYEWVNKLKIICEIYKIKKRRYKNAKKGINYFKLWV